METLKLYVRIRETTIANLCSKHFVDDMCQGAKMDVTLFDRGSENSSQTWTCDQLFNDVT